MTNLLELRQSLLLHAILFKVILRRCDDIFDDLEEDIALQIHCQS